MVESFIAKEALEKLTEQPQTAVEKYWDNLDKTVEVEPAEKAKQEAKITGWWDNLEKTTDNSDKPPEKTDIDYGKELVELREEYINDLKENSEYPETIEDDNMPYEKISPEENAKMREEFEEKKEALIKEWEEKNGKEWPRYKEDVYDEKTGTCIRRAGDRYDAHHIHPLTLGGRNTADNITPISAEKHYDKRVVHAPDSPYGRLEKLCREAVK